MAEATMGEPEQPTPHGTLGYRSVRDERPQAPKWVQALVGFLGCGAVTGALNFLGGFAVLSAGSRGARVYVAALVCLLGLVPFLLLGLSLRRRGRWMAFLPGVLAGWGVAALLEGICYADMTRGIGG
jgi:hypothetical protein